MKGLEISREYFDIHGMPMIERYFPDYLSVVAAGLVGEGSECLGFDDTLSQDHDFGPGFCLWLRNTDYNAIGVDLQERYEMLPKSFKGFSTRTHTEESNQRTGVFSIEEFYCKYTNTSSYPTAILQWFKIPMHYLRTVTNGEVFYDPLGDFSEVRAKLKDFYPVDVVRKKLVAQVFNMGQAGQYNYRRSMDRKDYGAAYLSATEFVRASLSVMYLLNRVYMPFYKWAFRGAELLECCQESLKSLQRFRSLPDSYENATEKIYLIESICSMIDQELIVQGFSQHRHDFLVHQAEAIQKTIENECLRKLPITFDFTS